MLETSKPEWHRNSWWGVMMINFCTAGLYKTGATRHAYERTRIDLCAIHTYIRRTNLSREHLHNLLWCFYHSVFDPTFLLPVCLPLKPGQFKWPGATSSEWLTQQPSNHCVLTNTTIICNKWFCFFTLRDWKHQISYPIFLLWNFVRGSYSSHTDMQGTFSFLLLLYEDMFHYAIA